jgi:hypothetical protein
MVDHAAELERERTKKKQNLEANPLPVVRGNSGKNPNQYEQDLIEALWQFGRIV